MRRRIRQIGHKRLLIIVTIDVVHYSIGVKLRREKVFRQFFNFVFILVVGHDRNRAGRPSHIVEMTGAARSKHK